MSPRIQQYTVPWPYTFFQLYLEPVFALSGAVLALSSPRSFLCSISTVTSSLRLFPSSSCTSTSPAPEAFLLANLAACYGFFSLVGLVLLRRHPPTSESALQLWKEVLAMQLVSDLGHLAALAMLGDAGAGAGGEWWAWGRWEKEGWTNVGILCLDVVVRCAFLAGWGIKEVR